MKKNLPLTSIALFAGAGGLHHGMEQAGIKVMLAADKNPASLKTHKANWPKIPFICEDVRKIKSREILLLTKGKRPEIVFGGPPCQGFSTLGDKLSGDPRNELFDAFARLVKELNPRCFLMENVKSLVTMYGGRFKEYILTTFSALGYKVYWKILNAADFGVPQIRYRVFFFGTKSQAPFMFPKPTHGDGLRKGFETVRNAIKDLEHMQNGLPSHIILRHSDIVVKRYKLIPEGGKLPPPSLLPKEIRRRNFGNTYKRLSWDKPSLTMVPGNNAFPIHPSLHRSLTPREAARLQTFPDSFLFQGDRRTQCILVGNAVPPLLAKRLGQCITKHLQQKHKKITISFSSSCSAPCANVKPALKNSGFVDLFSGAGGFLIGLKKAGLHPLLSVDNNHYVEATHRKNFPDVPFHNLDLSKKTSIDNICSFLNGKDVFAIVGGPPCQGFSIFGKRRFVNTSGYDPGLDPRNKLIFSYIELIRRIQPKWFVMENVPGLATLDEGLFLKKVLFYFRNSGYENVDYKILTAADYGVPQLRKRLVIMGNRTGHILPWPKKKYFSEPKAWQRPYRTVGEVISDLVQKSSFRSISCHKPMKHKPLLVERYKYIPEGGVLNIDNLPNFLKKGYRTDNVKNYSHIFKRLHRDRPSITIVPGHNALPIHYSRNRALTVREAARIQTFPDEVEFIGPRQEQCIQVGNAFPCLLAEIIANNIIKAERNNWFPGKVPASAFYTLVDEPS